MDKKLKTLKTGEHYIYDLGDDNIIIGSQGVCIFNKKEERYLIDASIWKSSKTVRVGDKNFRVEFQKIMKAEEVEEE